MRMQDGELTARSAVESDAPQLCAWWNDGRVMEHAGFPNGLGTSQQDVRAQIARSPGLMILELSGRPIGEMHYRPVNETTATIGIKICEISEQGNGLGTRALLMLIEALFGELGFEGIELHTGADNLRAQHVYEKLGFVRTGVRHVWTDALGQEREAVGLVLTREREFVVPPFAGLHHVSW